MKALEALQRVFVLPAPAPAVTEQREQPRRGLRVGNLGLLIEHERVGEILEHAEPQPLPRAAPWCSGLISLRGRLLPAFDLHEYLGLGRLRAPRQWWLALGSDANSVAFLVDELPQTVLVKQTAALAGRPALPDNIRRHIGDAYYLSDDLWFDFRHHDFFAQLAAEVAK